jgi:hypothetical protein
LLIALHFTASQAQLIYDNSGPGDPTGVWYFQGQYNEYGDEIILQPNTGRVLTQFQFEYYGAFTPTGNETAEVFIYANDGPKTPDGISTPGTVLFDSGSFSIFPNYETWTSSALNVTVPDDLTWAVKFSGLTGTNKVGILFQNPPSVGSSYNDAWLEANNAWETVQFTGTVANFAARLTSDPIHVSIQRSGPTVVVEWTGASILQEADEAAGPYSDQPQYRNRYTFPISSAPRKFWRLRD